MPRYRYKGNVPRPVDLGNGDVIAVRPGMEFDAPVAAVSALKKLGLLVEVPVLKVVKPKDAPRNEPGLVVSRQPVKEPVRENRPVVLPEKKTEDVPPSEEKSDGKKKR